MRHYAQVMNDMVVNVIIAEKEFIDKLVDREIRLETSRNSRGGVCYDPDTGEKTNEVSFRKNYAQIGYRYDSNRDAFIPPTPYPSWKLNEDTCLWEAPIPYPEDSLEVGGNKRYMWNENNLSWQYTGAYIDDNQWKNEPIE